MNYRILGRSGVKVSSLGLGTDNFANPTSPKESIEIIDRAIDAGIKIGITYVENVPISVDTLEDLILIENILNNRDDNKQFCFPGS